MTTFRRGDVVLVPFSFTDRSGSKWRPAVVVSSDQYNRQTPDVVIASVTGNLAAIPHPGDHRIQDWQTAGLLRPSLVQTKLATVESPLIGRQMDAWLHEIWPRSTAVSVGRWACNRRSYSPSARPIVR